MWGKTIWIGIFSIAGLLTQSSAFAANIALLVGVADYPHVTHLAGPINDVDAMRQVLSQKWGFKKQDMVILTNQQATQSNIVKALNDLKNRSQAGDQVFIYFSGHGTSRQDNKNKLPLPYNSGAFVPYDFDLEPIEKMLAKGQDTTAQLNQSLVIGREHILPVIVELEKTRDVVIVMDSCFSANATRSISLAPVKTVSRHIRLPTRAISDADLPAMDIAQLQAQINHKPEPYPYQNTISIAASGEDEEAADLPAVDSKFDGKAHGLLTDVLLRVLDGKIAADRNQDGKINYAELREVLTSEVGHYSDKNPQTPVIQPLISEDHDNITFKTLLKPRKIAPEATQQTAPSPVVEVSNDALNIGVQQVQNRQALNEMLSDLGLSVHQQNNDFVIIEHPDLKLWTLANTALEPITAKTTLSVIQQRLKTELWLRTLQQQLKNPAQLQFTTTPELKGNGFKIGEQFKFLSKAAQDYALILFNIDAQGQFHLLYPIETHEHRMFKASQVFTTPSINAQAPVGLDSVVAVGVSQPLSEAQLQQLLSIADKDVSIEHPVVRALTQWLQQSPQAGFQHITLRTYP